MPFTYDDFDLTGIRTYPLKSRPSKAKVEDFARPVAAGATVAQAQTPAFTYQGRLTDGVVAANGTYQMQLSLCQKLWK